MSDNIPNNISDAISSKDIAEELIDTLIDNTLTENISKTLIDNTLTENISKILIDNTSSGEDKNIRLVICPHCSTTIDPTDLNCKIYRCGVYKISSNNNESNINPHLSKIECDKLVENDLIWGCSKPFRIIGVKDEFFYEVEICDYI